MYAGLLTKTKSTPFRRKYESPTSVPDTGIFTCDTVISSDKQ